MNAVDTNVFIYSLDADDAVKQSKAQALLSRLAQTTGSTVLPWQVAAEILANLRKRESAGRIPPDEVASHLRVAACKEAGVTTLYSEDMGAGTDYDGLIVVNPFA